MRKRIYQPEEKDQIFYEIQEAQEEIKRLKAKPYLSEWEYQDLQMAQAKLRTLRSM